MVNQMMRKGIWPFQRVKCKAFCGKAEAISRINISSSTLINHYIKEQLQDEENLILPTRTLPNQQIKHHLNYKDLIGVQRQTASREYSL